MRLSPRWRRAAVRVHLRSGLIAGPLVLVMGLSGAALVFRPELEEALAGAPAVTGVAVAGPPAAPSLDAVLRAALVHPPRGQAHALRVPSRPDRPYRVEIHHAGLRLDVAMDPFTLRVLASRAPERSVLAAVHSLHATFHGGRAGAVLVGVLGLWLVLEGLTGLWLSRPRPAPKPARGARARRRSFHQVLGVASLAVSLVVAVTGALLAWASLVGRGESTVAPPSAGLARPDAIVARVEAAAPGARVIALVAESDRTVRVDVRSAAGRDGVVRVDRRSGAVVEVRMEPWGGWDLVRRLHAGDFAGTPSRILYAAVALALPVLSITGFVTSARRQSSNVLT